MAPYWVIGGEYVDTNFRDLAPGKKEERYGPFQTYHEAYQEWSGRARATIDDATVRYRIVESDASSASG